MTAYSGCSSLSIRLTQQAYSVPDHRLTTVVNMASKLIYARLPNEFILTEFGTNDAFVVSRYLRISTTEYTTIWFML